MKKIDTSLDFIEFNNMVKQKHGDFYTKQVDLFFERAMINSQNKLYHSAIQDCKFALALNEFSSNPINKHYLIGYISQLYCDLNQMENAMYYYQLGIDQLETSCDNYKNDLNLYNNLREHFDFESWKVA